MQATLLQRVDTFELHSYQNVSTTPCEDGGGGVLFTYTGIRLVRPTAETRVPAGRVSEIMAEWLAEHLDGCREALDNWTVRPEKWFHDCPWTFEGCREGLFHIRLAVWADYGDTPSEDEILAAIGGRALLQRMLRSAIATALDEAIN
jgi:hypothetical protein